VSYLLLQGTVMNILTTPEGVNKEGEPYGGKHQLQLLVNDVLKNGETRMNVINLNVPDRGAYEGRNGEIIQLPVGIFVPAGTKFSFFAAKERIANR
jgi:hypothetical protein